MKTLTFIGLFFALFSSARLSADIPDISEKSPDGRWVFKAHWIGDKGYSWAINDTRSAKIYFAAAHPEAEPSLPARLNVIWSPNNHYLVVNARYGRLDYGVTVYDVRGNVPQLVDFPRAPEASMIKPEDKALWSGTGVANCSTDQWGASDTITVDIDMRTELNEMSSGQKYRIDSTRQETLQFTDLKGKIINDAPPQYDKQPARND